LRIQPGRARQQQAGRAIGEVEVSEALETGLAIFGEVYGAEAAEGCRQTIETADDFTALHARWSMEWAFGSLWTRDALPRKMRSLAVLGMMIGLRQYDEIKYHTIMGMANGLTREEIEEVFYSAIPYCGFPIANTAKAAMLEGFAAFAERSGQPIDS
jgi:alkylhydroperoxidase/carboxymuconolactone decarboxylase family protein YurZ